MPKGKTAYNDLECTIIQEIVIYYNVLMKFPFFQIILISTGTKYGNQLTVANIQTKC